jgi:hypothetical protein
MVDGIGHGARTIAESHRAKSAATLLEQGIVFDLDRQGQQCR